MDTSPDSLRALLLSLSSAVNSQNAGGQYQSSMSMNMGMNMNSLVGGEQRRPSLNMTNSQAAALMNQSQFQPFFQNLQRRPSALSASANNPWASQAFAMQQRPNAAASSLASQVSNSNSFRHPSYTSRRRVVSEREKFLIFVKILLHCLKVDQVDPGIHPNAKAVVSECTRRNRMGDPNFSPLQPAVERRLRRTVGEVRWARARQQYVLFCQRKGIDTCIISV
jgi:hypothetical protein